MGLLVIILMFTGMIMVGCGGSSNSSTVPNPPTTTIPIVSPAPTPNLQNAIFVAPAGMADNPGTIESPTTLETAIKEVIPGGVIYLRGGNYSLTATVVIPVDNDGTATQPKYLMAYNSEEPVLDFSAQSYDAANPGNNARGLQINGDYWYIKGIKVCGSADNGIYIAGSHNTVENCEIYANRDSGLQLGRYDSSTPKSAWPAYNLILNCYSHDNYDPDNGEDADGFACKLTTGEGNVFRGCISAYNVDDGWDLFTKTETGAIGPVTLEYCIAYRNGQTSSGGSTTDSDGNGFKLGGDNIAVNHIVTGCIAFKNKKHGFTYNSNPGGIQVTHCTAWANGQYNYAFGKGVHIFTANLSWEGIGSDNFATGVTDNGNVWWQNGKSVATGGLSTLTAADFQSLTFTFKRDTDGSPSLGAFLKLATNSALVNKASDGYDIGARSNQSNDQF